ncbi:7tm Odorant receptor [Popillia japonica]|uniref:7tm Odorant receptor n=1 Tax=Popillia japonica TaxID=7064 RepID=A0AAW1LAN2_POPJA
MRNNTDTISILTVVTYAGVTFFQLSAYHYLGNEITYQDTSVVSIISICGYASVTFFQLLAAHIFQDTSVVSIISICGYASVTFFQLLAYHWIGHEIMEKSVKIIESSYLSMWYELDQKSKKTLILLTERAKRPLLIQPYKFVFISLDSLGVIVRWSYSFFALVKAKYS